MEEFEIIQQIFSCAISHADNGWTELMINCYVDEEQSDFGNSFLVECNGVAQEKSLPFDDNLGVLMRKLRTQLGNSGKQLFTHCILHVHADGKFEAKYSYESIDWCAVIEADWNFFPKKTR